MLNLKVLEDYILERRATHYSLPKDIQVLLDNNYELIADPITTETGTIYIIKSTDIK